MRNHGRSVGTLIVIGGLVGQALSAPAHVVRAADPVDVNFPYTAVEQTFVVPEGVTTIRVFLRGGHGGGATGSQWGRAHQLAGDLSVTPGQTLYVQVGGVGIAARNGGFNGGGDGGSSTSDDGYGGGGASDIRTISRNQAGTLDSRLMVAAGGGGGGTGGLRGGDAASAGEDHPESAATGGGPGTADAGGAGGTGGSAAGTAGDFGTGGTGGGGSSTGGGGGGAGGWYGGGGGSSGSFFAPSGTGGGGGSSYLGDATNTTGPSLTTLDPLVLITYTPLDPDPSPTPDSTPGTSGVVAGTVSAAESVGLCLIVHASTLDFGTNSFDDGTAVPIVATYDGTSQTSFDVENCGQTDVEVVAHGTDATSRASAATWGLTSIVAPATPCDVNGPSTTNAYGLQDDAAGVGVAPLTDIDGTVDPSLAAGTSRAHQVAIQMPCVGSDGAGEIFDLTVVYTAVVTEEPQ
jgi:hypothetical protein